MTLAMIAATESLETKKKIFQLNHGEWITVYDVEKSGIIRRSSARRNLVQLVDAGLMECDASKNAHRYRSIKPIDTEITLKMFMDIEFFDAENKNENQRIASSLSNEERRLLKEERINRLLPVLNKSTMTGADAAEFMGIDLSTAYRYLDELVKYGAVVVERKGRIKYFRSNGQVERIKLPKIDANPNTNVYKRRKRIHDLQKALTEKPESINEVAERVGIHPSTVQKFLASLYLEKGCKRDRVIKNKHYELKYFITPDCKEFEVGSQNPNYRHAKMPTDDKVLNAMMGYTDFIPNSRAARRYTMDKLAHCVTKRGVKFERSLTGNSMAMLEVSA